MNISNEREVNEIMYYTFGYEDYNGNKGEICVEAISEEEAKEKLSSYKVNRGELHYFWLKFVSNEGIEKYYNPSTSNGMVLAVALAGALLGCSQLNIYGIQKDYMNCLNDKDTIQILKNKV